LNSSSINNNDFVIALLDNRTGNRNQLLAILEELKLPYKVYEIKYNFLAKLPNFLIQIFGGNIHVKNFNIQNFNVCPKLILSCGRRTFPISLKLKLKIYPSSFLVHLMYPKYSLNIKKCNLIFTPNHDSIKLKKNIIKTIGSPGSIKFKKKKKSPYIVKPIVSLLIGGNHGKYKLKPENINTIIKKILKNINEGTVLISTSRRTPNGVIEAVNQWHKNNYLIKDVFHPKLNIKNNPLADMILFSDELVVTGDSVTMLSEVCQYKKPVRIYFNKSICSPKHIRFCEQLIQKGYAFPFDTLLKKHKKISILNTTKIISKRILGLLNNEKY
jgi:mitochondrial fission protein ELM1